MYIVIFVLIIHQESYKTGVIRKLKRILSMGKAMVETLTLSLNGRNIKLFNSTVTNKCLIFENPELKIEISLRDAISFDLKIINREESFYAGIFNYRFCCMLEKKSFFILKVFDQNTGKEIRRSDIPLFFEAVINDIFRQLKEEILYPFKDKEYLDSYIQDLENIYNEN